MRFGDANIWSIYIIYVCVYGFIKTKFGHYIIYACLCGFIVQGAASFLVTSARVSSFVRRSTFVYTSSGSKYTFILKRLNVCLCDIVLFILELQFLIPCFLQLQKALKTSAFAFCFNFSCPSQDFPVFNLSLYTISTMFSLSALAGFSFLLCIYLLRWIWRVSLLGEAMENPFLKN